MTENDKPKYYEASEAAEYLSQKWGRPYSSGALKKLRQRQNIQPFLMMRRASLWTQEELDAIPEPKPGRKKKQENDREEGPNSSVRLAHLLSPLAC